MQNEEEDTTASRDSYINGMQLRTLKWKWPFCLFLRGPAPFQEKQKPEFQGGIKLFLTPFVFVVGVCFVFGVLGFGT